VKIVSQEIYSREFKEKKIEFKVTKKDEKELEYYIISTFAVGS
jgi:hypothetical protein